MISVLVISIGKKENEKIKMFVESIFQKCSPFLKEVVIIYNKIPKFRKEYFKNKIKIKEIGTYDEKIQ